MLSSAFVSLHAQAEAFATGVRQTQLEPYARTVARAIQSGGQSSTTAYTEAFSQAIAGEEHFLSKLEILLSSRY